RGRRAPPRVLFQTPQGDRFEVAIDLRVEPPRRGGLLVEHLLERVHQAGRLERGPAGEALVEDRPQRVHVARRAHVFLPRACSGAMYDGVPMTSPVRVWLASSSFFANPKSATLGVRPASGGRASLVGASGGLTSPEGG